MLVPNFRNTQMIWIFRSSWPVNEGKAEEILLERVDLAFGSLVLLAAFLADEIL